MFPLTGWWTYLGVAAVSLLVVGWQGRAATQARHTEAWLERQDLPIRPADRAQAQAWRARELRGRTRGTVAGVATYLPFAVFVPVDPDAAGTSVVVTFLAPAVVITAAASVGVLLSAVRFRRPSVAVRVAHPWAPRLRDYLGRTELVLVRGTAAVVVVLALVRATTLPWSGTGFGHDESGPVWLALAIALVGWTAAELAVRRVLRVPQTAADPLALAWADAVRSEQVRIVYQLLVSFVPFLVLVVAMTVSRSSSFLGNVWPLAVYLATFLASMATEALGRRPVRTRHRTAVADAGRLQTQRVT